MPTPLTRIVVAAALSLPLSLDLAAGQAVCGPAREAGASPAGSTLDRAQGLLASGRSVFARALVQRVLSQGGAALGDADRERAFRVWSEADAAVQKMHPLDVSLQKAELALDEGDVRTGERHARAVLGSASAGPDRATAARALLDRVGARRSELAPLVPEALAQAEADFTAGRYAQAKAGLAMVDRSGVELGADQRALLNTYQTRIVEIERQEGRVYEIDGMAGVFQPGVVRRRQEREQPPPQPPPAEQAPPPPVELPGEPSQPPPREPVQPPGDEDLINQALRFEAQGILADADRAFAESQYNSAQTRYRQLRSQYQQFLTPDQLRHVEDRLAEISTRLGEGGPDIGTMLQDVQLRHDAALAAFENLMDQAERALATGDTDEARQKQAEARLRISQDRDAFRESELEGLFERTERLRADIQEAEQRLAAEAARRADEQMQRQAEQQAKEAREARARKINELLDRARAYQAELRYEDALQAIDQLLFLDPINPSGLLLRDLYGAILIYREYNAMQREKNLEFAHNSIENQGAAIPPRNIINYPRDWPAISLARGETVAYGDSPENRRTVALMESPDKRIPSVDFADNALEDVVAFFRDFTQIDVDVDWASLEVAGIGKDATVSLRLTNATPRTVLDRVLSKLGDGTSAAADWMVRDGIVVIGSDEFVRKHTALAIYDVSDLIVEIPDYDEVPLIDLQSVLQSSGGRGGGGGGRSPFRDDQQDQQDQRDRDRDQKMDEVIAIVTDNVDYDGWQDNGGSTGKITKLVNQGQLIITNTPKNHAAIEGLLGKLRAQRAMQINVETRFLLVNQDFFEQIGFDLDVYINANNNQFRAARANAPAAQPSDFFRDGRLLRSITSPGIGPATGPVPPVTQGVVNPRNWSPIGFQQDSLGLAAGLAPSQGIAADILGGAPALGIAGQWLDDVQVDFLVQATQADRRSVQLTAPRVTFTNGQTSNIFVATQQAFVSDLAPVVGDSAVGFDPTVDVITEGVTLLVTGTVTSDRRYVTMNIDAGVSRIDGFANQAVTAVAGGQLVNSADTQSFIQLPTVTVTRVRTTVTVPDQGTLLLGGQRLVTEFEVEAGVPVLSKIPVLNRFFTNRIESKEEQTLLILVKPTVLIQNEEEERNFPGLNEQIRFGG